MTNYDVSEPGGRALAASSIKDRINSACKQMYGTEPPRGHLGASVIGRECSRALWYSFRWCSSMSIDGKLGRLFNRGHLEELRIVPWLREAGIIVREFQPDGKTQLRMSGVGGHYGGSLDGLAWLPAEFEYEESLILEMKTSNDAQFKKLVKEGVKLSKPEHFAQMSVYGEKYGAEYGLYVAVNKNNDDIHVEVVLLSHALARELEVKASEIITAQEPPRRLTEISTDFRCRYCDSKGICHADQPPLRNCRSCKHASACQKTDAAPSGWACAMYGACIPEAHLLAGCDKYEPIV